MYDFAYQKAGSVEDAVAKLRAAEDGKLLAGGQTLLPTLKQRLASPSDVIDLAGVDSLRNILVTDRGGNIVIGAMVTHAEVAGNGDIQGTLPALADLASHIGDPQVRNRGTLGGSLANSDPAADYPAAVLGLGARIHTDRRMIEADDYFTGLFETALAEDEIITEVRFPVPERAAYAKFPNPASRYAIVGVFVARFAGGVRVAVTGAGPNAFRQSAMESALSANFSPDAIDGVTVDAAGLNSDIHASAAYRAHLVKVMARRAVRGVL